MIYVITRTNKRPNKFKVCAESVQMQELGEPLTHVTLSEDKLPDYVRDYTDEPNKHRVLPKVLKKSEFKHYNNYLDWAMQNLGKEGDYFACLDDDDFYLWNDSLQYAIKEGEDAELTIWRVNSAVGVVPSRQAFDAEQIQSSNISGIGFLIRKGSFKEAKFGDATLGDYRFLAKAAQEVKSVAWVDAVLSSVNPHDKFGGGREGDGTIERVRDGFELAKKHFKHFRKWI